MGNGDREQCSKTITFTGAIFVLFYGSLVAIILAMYCRYRRELRNMAKNESADDNFRLVKKLMAQYDQKHDTRQISVPYGESRTSGLIIKDLDKTKDSDRYNHPQKRKSRSGYIKHPFSTDSAPLGASAEALGNVSGLKEDESQVHDRSQGLIEERSFDRELEKHHSMREQTQILVGPNDLRRSADQSAQQQRSTSSDLLYSKNGNRVSGAVTRSFEQRPFASPQSSSSGDGAGGAGEHERIKTVTLGPDQSPYE